MNSLLNTILIAICVVLLGRWIYQGVRLYRLYRQKKHSPKKSMHSARFHQKERKIIWLAPATKMLSGSHMPTITGSKTEQNRSPEPWIKHQNREHADLVKK